MRKYYIQIYRHTLPYNDDDTWVDINSLEIHPEIVVQMADLGIVELCQGHIPARHVIKLQKLMRIRRNLGVNLPGSAIILDLLEKVEELQAEIIRLRRR